MPGANQCFLEEAQLLFADGVIGQDRQHHQVDQCVGALDAVGRVFQTFRKQTANTRPEIPCQRCAGRDTPGGEDERDRNQFHMADAIRFLGMQ